MIFYNPPDSDTVKKNTTKYSEANITWLFNDWYDGEIEGMIVLNNKKYWAFWFDEDEKQRRQFIILDIGKDRINYEEYWENLSKLCFGPGGDWKGAANKFFWGRKKKDYKDLDITKYPVIGWFEWGR